MDVTNTYIPGHRKLIVPQGLLDADINNVIHIPNEVANTQSPMVASRTRRGLVARVLPEFNDELSEADQSVNLYQHLSAAPKSCEVSNQSPKKVIRKPVVSSKGLESSKLQSDSTQSSRYKTHAETMSGNCPIGDITYSKGDDTPTSPPKILHASTKFSEKLPNSPKESKSVTIDAPDGVDVNTLKQIIARGNTVQQQSPVYARTQAGIVTSHPQSPNQQPSKRGASHGYRSPPVPSKVGVTTQFYSGAIAPSTPTDTCAIYQCADLGGQQTYPSIAQSADEDNCVLYQCPAPCSSQGVTSSAAQPPGADTCIVHQCPAPCGPQGVTNQLPGQPAPTDTCIVYHCPAPCSPLPSPVASPNYTRQLSLPSNTSRPNSNTSRPNSNTSRPNSNTSRSDEQCVPCDQNDSVISSFQSYDYSYHEKTQDPNAYRYTPHNVVRRYEDTPPSLNMGIEKNWRQEIGGFQPKYISTPNETFASFHASDFAEETGYHYSDFAPSDVERDIWETPPSLGLPKAKWCFDKTEYIDPFEEERKRIQNEQKDQRECRCPSSTY